MQKEWAIKEDFIFKYSSLIIRKPKALLVISPVLLINKKSPEANVYNVIYFFATLFYSLIFRHL